MKQLSKQFNKLNQLVGEKFNNAAKHELDEEFKNLETQTELKRYGEDLIFYAMNTYMKTLEKKGESNDKQKRLAVESLGNAMITFGSDLDPSSQYGQVLIKMGEAQERLGFIQQEFVSTVKVSITKKEEHMQELKQYRHLKGKMVNRRLDYDGLLNKLQKSTKENHKLDEQMRTAQDKYEEIVSEMRQVMTNINAREERHIKELIEFLDAQKEYHQKSLDTLNSLGKIILDSSVQGIRRPSKEKGSYKNLGYQTPTRSNSFGIASRSQSLHTIYNQGALLPRTDLTTETDNMTSSVRSDKCFVRANFSFSAENEYELSIKKGDVVLVVEEIDEGWWAGELNGKRGLFPANYCTKIDTSSSSTAQPSGGLSNSDLGNDIIVCKCGCDDFLVDLFKKGYCNRCSHKH